MLIDFEKAFDSIRWKSIDQALTYFNFGPMFKKWVNLMYMNTQSAIMNNGHMTEFFSLERGVRQGCPLSVYLFIIVAELLAIKVRNDNRIEGITINDKEIKFHS